jgi:hypothetical protein
MSAGEERRGEPGLTAGPADAVPEPAAAPVPERADAVQETAAPVPERAVPARRPEGTQRVRRPADLLLAVISALIITVVIGSIRALPLGSTEVADDVSSWLLHIPRWLASTAAVVAGVACFVLVIAALVVLGRTQWRDARNAVVAGLAGAAAAIVASVIWRTEHAAVQHAVLHGSNPSTFVVDTAFVAFVVGTDLTRRSRWKHWWPRAAAALLLSGLAVRTLTPFAVVIRMSRPAVAVW